QFNLEFRHDESAAAARCRRAVELDPDDEEARLLLVVALLATPDAAQATEAAEHLDYVRQRQPDNLNVLVGLAQCRDVLGQPDEAMRLVNQVLAQQAEFPPALALRGRLAFNVGQFEEAETWLRRALQADPANHLARHELALCLLRNGNVEEARQQEQ